MAKTQVETTPSPSPSEGRAREQLEVCPSKSPSMESSETSRPGVASSSATPEDAAGSKDSLQITAQSEAGRKRETTQKSSPVLSAGISEADTTPTPLSEECARVQIERSPSASPFIESSVTAETPITAKARLREKSLEISISTDSQEITAPSGAVIKHV